MPRLETFDIEIRTGDRGRGDAPGFFINGFPCDFEKAEGGCSTGQVFKATGAPMSFAHTLRLAGPKSGEWDVKETRITFHPSGEESWSVRFGAVTLDAKSDMNIWQDRPAPTFDV